MEVIAVVPNMMQMLLEYILYRNIFCGMSSESAWFNICDVKLRLCIIRIYNLWIHTKYVPCDYILIIVTYYPYYCYTLYFV